MTAVREEGQLGAAIDEVWKVVGDFGGFVEAMGVPVEVSGDGIGATRTIALGPSPTVERLEELDNDAKRLVYSMLEGPLPLVRSPSGYPGAAAGAASLRSPGAAFPLRSKSSAEKSPRLMHRWDVPGTIQSAE